MQVSQPYTAELTTLEGIGGKTSAGDYGWFYDDIGVATVGNGHALVDPNGNHIRRGEANVAALAQAAVDKLGYGQTLTPADVADLKAKDLLTFSTPVSAMVRTTTTQAQFDALVDFSYNLGVGALKSSSLLRMHNAGNAVLGSQDMKALAAASQAHVETTIGEAFGAWSNAGGKWTRGVFHRRMWEFLIYSGMDYAEALSTGYSF